MEKYHAQDIYIHDVTFELKKSSNTPNTAKRINIFTRGWQMSVKI